MGRAERTENDPQFGILSDKTDKTKNYTEKLVKVKERKHKFQKNKTVLFGTQ